MWKISWKHPQFDITSCPNSGYTGAPPLSGNLCADALTFTSHEEQLKKTREQVSSRYRSVQLSWFAPVLIIFFSYLLKVELTASLNFVTKTPSLLNMSECYQQHTPPRACCRRLRWTNRGDLSISLAPDFRQYVKCVPGAAEGVLQCCCSVREQGSLSHPKRKVTCPR